MFKPHKIISKIYVDRDNLLCYDEDYKGIGQPKTLIGIYNEIMLNENSMTSGSYASIMKNRIDKIWDYLK
jgi:hypothetical protein